MTAGSVVIGCFRDPVGGALVAGDVIVVVDVVGERVGIPRADLEIMSEPPRRWSVVPRPKNPSRFPGVSEYGVCPNCRERVPLPERLSVLRCTRCNGAFDVAWEEQYLMEN